MKQLARQGYLYGTWLILILVIGQFLLAGMGVFSLLGPNADGKGATFLLIHGGINPLAIFVASLLMIGCGLVGRLPRRMTGLPAAFIGLLIVQSLLLIPYHSAIDSGAMQSLRFISGLHVVNALFIFWLALQLPFWARRDIDSLVGQAAQPVPA